MTRQASSRSGQDDRPTDVTRRASGCARAVRAEPDHAHFNERGFIDRLRAGDHEAYRDLVRHHHTALVSLAARLSRNRATAEDVVQEVWVIILANPHLLDQHTAFGVWIAGLVTSVAQAGARRQHRLRGFSEAGRIDANGEPLPPVRTPPSPAGRQSPGPGPWDRITPEIICADRQLIHHLDRAIDTLPHVQRAAIHLRDIQGHGSSETCRLLGISPVNLRVLLHRARVRLRASIDRVSRPAPSRPAQAVGADPLPEPASPSGLSPSGLSPSGPSPSGLSPSGLSPSGPSR